MNSLHLPSMINQQDNTVKPTKIANYYTFTPQNMPKVSDLLLTQLIKVQCHYHPEQSIVYFCKEPECLMPLCQTCVSVHQTDHSNKGTRSNIVPLEACLTETYQQLANYANQLIDNQEQIQLLSEGSVNTTLNQHQSLLTNPISLIDSARDQVHTIVDNYFNSLTTFIKSRIPESLIKRPDTFKINSELSKRWEEMIRELEILNSNQCLQELIHNYSGEIDKDNFQINQLSNQALQELQQQKGVNLNGQDIPQLHIDPTFLQRFLWTLERYAYFYVEDDYPIQQPVFTTPPPPPPQRIIPPPPELDDYVVRRQAAPPQEDKRILYEINRQPIVSPKRSKSQKRKKNKSSKKKKTMVIHHVQDGNQQMFNQQPFVQMPQPNQMYVSGFQQPYQQPQQPQFQMIPQPQFQPQFTQSIQGQQFNSPPKLLLQQQQYNMPQVKQYTQPQQQQQSNNNGGRLENKAYL